ncbi:MAG: Gfo/Idh/MocA family oxidoreductase [Acidobacteriaceae bacterium]|nr:Gfo/Idh/MocA family oxidoreductase [Acidobacteriaceae bacterium]MBV9780595.1 Gfo/Idh/MocA family oxidoreductase [Acidobacteriaceae bacterium]
MSQPRRSALLLFALSSVLYPQQPSAPLRIGVVGLVHGHVAGFFSAAINRNDVQIAGVAEPDRKLFDRYAQQYRLDPNLYSSTLDDMISRAHPQAVVVYTNTFDHRKVVEECARRSIHVMMEKPLAVSYEDARAISTAATTGKIQVLVNYETTWYASNEAAFEIVQHGELGTIHKMVFHDGHPGPKEIHVAPEFLAWLTDPKLNGAGALYDFACYGADLATRIMRGQRPQTVTAVTQHFKPIIYPRVDDEANVILTYPSAVAILQASWNWPFDRKDMEIYGQTGYVKTIVREKIEFRRQGQKTSQTANARPLIAPYDDPLHYFAALIKGKAHEEFLSSLSTNLAVSEILDAARRSAESGNTVTLPLAQ